MVASLPRPNNGFNVNISDADGLELPKQVRDAVRMLRRDAVEFRRLKRLKLHGVLDFAVEVKDRDGPAFFRSPSELLRLLAKYELGLEVSYYGGRIWSHAAHSTITSGVSHGGYQCASGASTVLSGQLRWSRQGSTN